MPKTAPTPAPKADPASKPAPRQRRKARFDVDTGHDAAKRIDGHAPDEAKPQPSIKTTPKMIKPDASKPTKPASPSRTKPQPSKLPSALDAAAQVLAGLSKSEASTGLTAPDLIERMAKAKLWISPGGKTPAATLYAAMIRETTKKGKASRFVRISPGHFAAVHTTKLGGKS